jgi:hypothetical protein
MKSKMTYPYSKEDLITILKRDSTASDKNLRCDLLSEDQGLAIRSRLSRNTVKNMQK